MRKFASVKPVESVRNGMHLVRNRKTLWQMLRAAWSGQYKMSVATMAIMLIALVYIVFPFDLIPDFIPVIGWMDDGMVIYLLLKQLVKETQRFNRHKAMARKVVIARPAIWTK